jgi:hypothetical protein
MVVVKGDDFVEHGSPVAVVCLGLVIYHLQPVGGESEIDLDISHAAQPNPCRAVSQRITLYYNVSNRKAPSRGLSVAAIDV